MAASVPYPRPPRDASRPLIALRYNSGLWLTTHTRSVTVRDRLTFR